MSISVFRGDVMLRTGDVYTLLAIARLHNLSAVQPSVACNHELCLAYGFLRQRSCASIEKRYRNGLLSKEELLVRWRFMLEMGLLDNDKLVKKLESASMGQSRQLIAINRKSFRDKPGS
jgi:hypothetical protein